MGVVDRKQSINKCWPYCVLLLSVFYTSAKNPFIHIIMLCRLYYFYSEIKFVGICFVDFCSCVYNSLIEHTENSIQEYMLVCMCVCVCCVCVRARTCECVRAWVCVCAHECVCGCVHAWMCVYVCVCVNLWGY